ncbi:MAG: type I phosphomannose isomerase catalytic subunit [Lachnospiraceae bacterium]
MSILKLSPACKSYLWGGNKLKREFHKNYAGSVLAETWELSCHPDGPSTIVSGEYKGLTLREYLEKTGGKASGTNCERFEDFPILIKLIDASKELSVQVHPNNSYARKHENQYGKTEMWYVIDCEPGAFLYYGLKRSVTKEEFRKHIEENTLDQILNAVPVHKGDTFFIAAGTVHAIGKGIVIAEIQQNSNVTYRVYDYGRIGADGKPRDLHVEKALDVAHLEPPKTIYSFGGHLAQCDCFTVDRFSVQYGTVQGVVEEDSFQSLLIVDGDGEVRCGDSCEKVRKGDSLFLPAGSGTYTVTGSLTLLRTSIPPKPVYRIGIDLGGTAIKVGIIDQNNGIAGRCQLPTEADRPWQHVVDNICKTVMGALEDAELTLADCVSAGVGSPGTIDAENGTVVYSNNFGWHDVPLEAALQEKLGLPVHISNDANCAALGEVVAGAAKGCQNAVLITLGTGVGSGIIMGGHIFEGGGPGGAELGHTMLHKDGELCTCGRHGCLEAYTSATALIREAKRAANQNPESKLMQLCEGNPEHMNGLIPFEAAKQQDAAACCVIDRYINDLADGIADAVNLFRPQMVLLGGGISKQGSYLTDPLKEKVAHLVFGGEQSFLPEIRCAELENDAGMIGAANL